MFENHDFGLIYLLIFNLKSPGNQSEKPLSLALLAKNFCNLKESSSESVDAQNQNCFMHQKFYNTKR